MMNQEEDNFRPDDMLTYEEFSDFILKFAELDPELRDSIKSPLKTEVLNILGADRNETALSNAKEPYGVAKKNEVTRQEVYTVLANIMEMRGQASKNLPSDTEVHPVH